MLAPRPSCLPTLGLSVGRQSLRLLSLARPSSLQFPAVSARRVQPLIRNLVYKHHFATSPSSSSQVNPTPSANMTTFYDLKAELPGGKTYDFSQLKGKVVLIVNTASKWYVFARASD